MREDDHTLTKEELVRKYPQLRPYKDPGRLTLKLLDQRVKVLEEALSEAFEEEDLTEEGPFEDEDPDLEHKSFKKSVKSKPSS